MTLVVYTPAQVRLHNNLIKTLHSANEALNGAPTKQYEHLEAARLALTQANWSLMHEVSEASLKSDAWALFLQDEFCEFEWEPSDVMEPFKRLQCEAKKHGWQVTVSDT